MTPNSGNSGHSGRFGANHGGANHGGSNYSGRPGRDERTEFFRGDDRTEYFGSNEQTQYIDRPRQYFPDQDQNQGPQGQQGQPQTQQYQGPYPQGFGQNQYGQQYGQPYNSGYAPAAQQATVHNAHQPQQTAQASGGSSSWQMLLGIISGLALLLAVVFFFLWRSADNEQATPPTPTTVTSTQTEEVNVTVTEPTTVIEEPVLPGGDGGSWRDQIPTEVPEELLPPEGEEFDLRSWLSNIFG